MCFMFMVPLAVSTESVHGGLLVLDGLAYAVCLCPGFDIVK